MDWDIDIPKKIRERQEFYKKEILKAAKKDLVITELYTDDIVETIAFNRTLNAFIIAGFFDEKLEKDNPIGLEILRFLEDLKIYREPRVLYHFGKSRLGKRSEDRRIRVRIALNLLISNGFIKIHPVKEYLGKSHLIGRGPCIYLWAQKDHVKLSVLMKQQFGDDEGVRDKISGGYPFLSYTVSKFKWNPKKKKLQALNQRFVEPVNQFNYMLEHGLIEITEQDKEHVYEYKVTDVGKYVANILNHCKIAQL